MRTGWMAVAATLLLFFPHAAGDPDAPAPLDATAVTTDDGVLQGILAGLVWRTPQSGQLAGEAQQPPDPQNATAVQDWAGRLGQATDPGRLKVGRSEVPVPRFTLEAGHAVLTHYEQDRYPTGADLTHPSVPPTGSPTRPPPAQASNSTWTGLRIDVAGTGDNESARLLVMPSGNGASEVRVNGGIQAVQAASDPRLVLEPRAGEGYKTLDLGQTVKVDAFAGGVTITGSFNVSLSSLRVPFVSDQGPGAFDSRTEYEERPPPVSYGATTLYYHSVEQEDVLQVSDATLTISDGGLYLKEATLATHSLGLEGCKKAVLCRQSADGSVHLQGDLSAALAPANEGLQVQLGGDLVRLSVDNQPRPVSDAFAASAPAPTGPSSGLYALALLAVPALPAAHWAAVRRRFSRMDQALDKGDFETALRLAGRFTAWPSLAQDSALAAAICLLGLGRPEEACERLSRPRWSPARRPMRDFLRARGHAALGQVEEATRALAASLLAEPGLIGQARTDPVLSSLIDGPRDSDPQEAYA